jgi:hypothetical protein
MKVRGCPLSGIHFVDDPSAAADPGSDLGAFRTRTDALRAPAMSVAPASRTARGHERGHERPHAPADRAGPSQALTGYASAEQAKEKPLADSLA